MSDEGKRARKRPLSAGRGADQFPLRLPEGMREQIKAIADENGRSMNQEIIEVLREVFPNTPTDSELMDQMELALAWAGDLKSANKRHTLHAHLYSFIDEMKKRTPPKERTAPYIEVDRSVLDLIDDLCGKLNERGKSSREWERDEVAENLIKMSLLRIVRGEENFKSVIVGTEGFEKAITVDIEFFDQ